MPQPPQRRFGGLSLLQPLRFPLFRSLWAASLVSNIGSNMHHTGAAWQMTLLTPSPLLLGLVTAAANLPLLLLSPLAGALTDTFDRRSLLLITQSLLIATAGTLAVLAFTDTLNPAGLLIMVSLMGLATVFNKNGWQTVVQDSVPREELAPAVSLASISMNSARSIGPALGGLIIAWIGAGMVFLLDSLSFFGVIFVIFRWKETQQRPPRTRGAVFRALKEGFLYLVSKRLLALLLVRHLLFAMAAASVMALLPMLARTRLGLDARGFGLLSSCFGLGAIVASLSAHSLAARFGVRRSTRAGIILSFSTLLAVAHCWHPVLAGVLLLFQGFSSTFIALNHGVRVRMSASAGFLGRVYSYYSLCATGGVALGGLTFGWLASLWGLRVSLSAAATLSFIALLLALRHPMPQILRESEPGSPAA